MRTTAHILAAGFILFAARSLAGEVATTKGIIKDPAAPPPADAVQLVGPESHALVPEGKEESKWVFADGVLTASPKWDSMVTKDNYQDFRLHVEFNVNKSKDAKDPEGDGNSGIYIQKRYEVQILNSAGVSEADYKPSYAGSIYKIKKPDHLVSKPAGEWQTYDLTLVNRHITVILNGEKVIDNQPVPGPTGGAMHTDPMAPGPIYLQGDHTTVAYRNILLAPRVK